MRQGRNAYETLFSVKKRYCMQVKISQNGVRNVFFYVVRKKEKRLENLKKLNCIYCIILQENTFNLMF